MMRTKSTEWTSLLVSLLLEGVSATLDQMGFALLGMIMAFIGLFFSVVDLILKAQQKRLIWVVGSSLLPCFRRNFSSKGKRFDSLVAYFGVACAAWQCLYSTTGYVYAHQNLGNPIRMCLLPFVFASCVGITQFIRSTVPSDKKSQATEARTAEEACENGMRSRDSQSVSDKKSQATEARTAEEAGENGMRSRDSQSVANGTQVEAEWMEEYEPGVYITWESALDLAALRDGTRDLNRVRFSRMRFEEHETAISRWIRTRNRAYRLFGRPDGSSVSGQAARGSEGAMSRSSQP